MNGKRMVREAEVATLSCPALDYKGGCQSAPQCGQAGKCRHHPAPHAPVWVIPPWHAVIQYQANRPDMPRGATH